MTPIIPAVISFLLLLAIPWTLYASHFEGTVRDKKTGKPLAAARVRVQATGAECMTDATGKFTLESTHDNETTLTAWREGYLNGGVTVPPDSVSPVEIALEPIFVTDNKDYRWVSPNPPTWLEWGDIIFWKGVSLLLRDNTIKSHYASNCSNCHGSTTVKEWRRDAHAGSATNPIVLSLYNGTSASGEAGVFPGYRLDFPNSAGNCATCHAPAAAVTNPWGTDLNEVQGVARHGVFCDVCHKVREVRLHPEGGFPGVLSLTFHRPPRGEQIFFGPLDDVIAGPDTYLPLFKESRFCAPCHSAQFWGVPIYSEYDEWLASPYVAKGKQCQDCHMAPDKRSTMIAPAEKGGIERRAETLGSHVNPSVRDRDFLAPAIKMKLKVRQKGTTLTVAVDLTNTGAGHHFPTGVPMRNMILLLDAEDALGKKLPFVKGSVIPPWGGEGPTDEGNYAGRPGKGFAKILADASKKFPRYDPEAHMPTPHWRQAVIVSDTRIPALTTDSSEYQFMRDDSLQGPVRVSARLFYRRAFKGWIDAKGWPLQDLEIAHTEEIFPERIP